MRWKALLFAIYWPYDLWDFGIDALSRPTDAPATLPPSTGSSVAGSEANYFPALNISYGAATAAKLSHLDPLEKYLAASCMVLCFLDWT